MSEATKPSGSFVLWQNTLCNPLADPIVMTHSAWHDGYASAKAEIKQEPVAWADDVGAVIPHSHKLFVPGLCKNYTRPLYAAPTKWKALTLEELDAIADVYMEKDRTIRAWGCFAQAIEDKLKEKNSGS